MIWRSFFIWLFSTREKQSAPPRLARRVASARRVERTIHFQFPVRIVARPSQIGDFQIRHSGWRDGGKRNGAHFFMPTGHSPAVVIVPRSIFSQSLDLRRQHTEIRDVPPE